ncbi:hypothetical protein DPMN_020862 [Dreissena polymorpha]|uniref:Uncharacterized protein n=1 Tax=Dreissena polymorpha TaxID=45954 RepID=A0A9D4S8M4_DREPO|nr:hypothetical protein DPMN_020862 [Dreissena polymorpha]
MYVVYIFQISPNATQLRVRTAQRALIFRTPTLVYAHRAGKATTVIRISTNATQLRVRTAQRAVIFRTPTLVYAHRGGKATTVIRPVKIKSNRRQIYGLQRRWHYVC